MECKVNVFVTAPLSVPHATVSEVEFHDLTIPKDTMVLAHLESVPTDHNFWDNAMEFINVSIKLHRLLQWFYYNIIPIYFNVSITAPLSVPHATASEVNFHDFTIPKDTMVLTHLESVHTDHHYWDNAMEFINVSIKLHQTTSMLNYNIIPVYLNPLLHRLFLEHDVIFYF